MKEKKSYILVSLILILFSCKKKPEIEVNFSLNKKDSVLLVKYSNLNQANYYLDFIPEFNDSHFRILPEGRSTFGFIFIPIIQKNDLDLLENFNCNKYNNYGKENLYQHPIFLKSNSSKIYMFKIKNYISGRTLKLESSTNPYITFLKDLEASNSTKEIEKLHALKDYKCNGYTYFTGDFVFNYTQLILP
ncbi:hypothetical protein EGY07_18980 [Chryseobacterium indologenes]|uniref:hypothetical protein n=2 Tax=Chryseobacterium indologenes TaxID=253 RepID=UPI000F4F55BB|nr:hypothetical protein [Chryseobacterium indologenes]AYZ37471.1 hypothetical protein EGY07_18980 [Chryseobacterium indologenes]MBF6646343.1 hypothetical protein [Chryseobacterium indologenes]MEB4761711.1 hypothetical protein [Chryseobacterium indologenes]QQQ69985.1 hypothetical protein JHW31_15920 [Chryseobacterium indologenes]